MLKYERIIKNLTIKEKLELITSCDFSKTREIENYEFPIMRITNLDELDFNFNKVGATFNTDLIRKSGIHNGVLKLNENDKTILALPITTEGKCFSTDPYLNGIFTASFAKGVEEAGCLTAYKLVPRLKDSNIFAYFNEKLRSFNVAINNYEPFMVQTDTSDSISYIDELGYDGFKVVLTKSQIDLINSINNKVNLSVSDNDNIEAIEDAIKNYNALYKKYSEQQITLTEFYTEINSSNALNPHDIDELVDKMLVALNVYECQNKPLAEEPNVEKEIARQSIVLLENNNILPIDRDSKASFIGEDLIKIAEKNDINLSDLIDQYGLNVKGIAHGYISDKPFNAELFEKAKELIDGSDYSFVFIDSLSPEKVQFIEEIKKIENKKIIYVLLFDGYEDLSIFADVDALVLSFDKRVFTVKTLLELFVGDFCPSGKLPFEALSKMDNVLFPLGRGLSFADIQYSNFSINDLSTHLTITNKSNFPAYETVLLYMRHEDDQMRELVGMKKVYLNKGESQIVEFQFDFDTFKKYDPDKKVNIVKGGNYEISLAKDAIDTIMTEVIKVEEEDDDLKFSSSKIEEENADTLKVAPRRIFNKNIKLAVAIIFSIYYYAFFILLLVSANNNESKIVCGVLIGVYTICLIIFSLINLVHYKKNKIVNSEEIPLDEAIANMKEFEEEYHSKYEAPIPSEPIVSDEEIEEAFDDIELPIDEDEEVVKKIFTYDSFGNQVDDYNEYDNSEEFDEICKRFVNYSLMSGIIIEANDARNLLASIFSNNLVVINDKSKEYNTQLFAVLSNFLGNTSNSIFDLENISDETRLYWKELDDKYELSELSEKLSKANGYTSRINLFVFKNATLDKINKLLKPFVEFASSPLCDHYIKLNNEYSIKISKNSVFVFLIDDQLLLENIDSELANSSLYLELLTRKNEIEPEEKTQLKLFSYQYIEFLIRNYREAYYLNEDLWKKLDDLCENPAFNEFDLDNKTVTVLEKLISFILANGNDSNEALNQAFKERLVPIFKTLKVYKNEKGDKELIDAIEKIFEDQLEDAIKLLKKKD